MSVLSNNSWVEQAEAFVPAEQLESGMETPLSSYVSCWLLAVAQRPGYLVTPVIKLKLSQCEKCTLSYNLLVKQSAESVDI